jgi:hypothetical protein
MLKTKFMLLMGILFSIPVQAGGNLLAVKVLGSESRWFFVCGNPAPVMKFEENSEWKRVDKSSVVIKPGSALDLSVLVDKPAGKYGRAVVGSGGWLAFEKNPDVPVRFFGFNRLELLRQTQDFSNEEFKKRATKLARAIRRQGYNMVRFNEPARFLCRGVKEDMTINPEMMDRFDFLLAEFKKEGVYSHVILLAYGLFYHNGGKGDGDVYGERNVNKLRMYLGEKNMRQRFRFGVDALLNHVNPYTGLAWKDDPVIAIVEFYNEQELGNARYRILKKKFATFYPKAISLLKQQWRTWLQNRFGGNSTNVLIKELNGTPLAQAPLPPVHKKKMPLLLNAFDLFIMDVEAEQVSWYENVVRKAGYRGITVQHNQSRRIGEAFVRWKKMRAIDIHSYFCHPKREPGKKGRIVEQDSSIEKMADYWRETNAGRFSGRPFFVSEYNHSFRNPYQYEGGLVFAAYSALQGHDALMRHSYAVVLDTSKFKMNAFSIGNNPISRASEFLSACLFARGDVKKSPHLVELKLSKDFTESACAMSEAISPKETLSSLLTGFCIAFPWAEKPKNLPACRKPDLTIVPTGTAHVNTEEWFSDVIDDGVNNTSYTATIVDKMKKRGILPPENQTDPKKGIYQSDTGEIIMRSEEKLLKVITSRSEAICIQAGKSEKLNHLEIISSSVPASIAVCSVDGKPLETSSRIVLIYSTVVANKEMELSGDGRIGIKNGDEMVTLMRTGKLQFTLKNSMGAKMALYSLGLDGSRQEKLPFEYSDGVVKIKLDTAQLRAIAPFFELVQE